MIKTTSYIRSLETPKGNMKIDENYKKFEDFQNKVWIDREELIKAISRVNKELYNDEFGLYEWNELLLKELGVDEE